MLGRCPSLTLIYGKKVWPCSRICRFSVSLIRRNIFYLFPSFDVSKRINKTLTSYKDDFVCLSRNFGTAEVHNHGSSRSYCKQNQFDKVLMSRSPIKSISLLPSNQVVTASEDYNLHIWNIDTGECERIRPRYEDEDDEVDDGTDTNICGYLACSLSDGRVVFTNDIIGDDIYLYDTKDKANIVNLTRHSDSCVNCLIVLSDNTIVSGSDEGVIRLWNPDTVVCLKELKGHIDVVCSLAVVSEYILASGSYDYTVRIWNITTGECMHTLKGHTKDVNSLCILSDGRLVSGSNDHTIRIWNIETGLCEMTLTKYTDNVTSLVVLSDGRLVSGSNDKTIRIWNTATFECEQIIDTGSGVQCLLVIIDGRILCGDNNGQLTIWGCDVVIPNK